MSVETRPLSGTTAARLLARLTLKRVLRSRAVWVSLVLSLLPAAFALLAVDDPGLADWRETFGIAVGLLAILPPLHLASAIAEEVEDNTFTYLWSRPLPRWSLIVGKLAALAPMLAILVAGGAALAFPSAYGMSSPDAGAMLGRAALALTVGVLGTGAIAMGIGSLVPKQALPTSIAYLLVLDLPLGALQFSLQNLSVTFHVRQIAGVARETGSVLLSALWAFAIGAVWMTIALWRVSRAEFATNK